jgi:hypothetical protein
LIGKNKLEAKAKRNHSNSKLILPCNSLDHGTTAFMQWLSSEDKESKNNPINLKEFVNNKYAILYDNNLADDVIVQTHDGIPQCRSCHTDDCAHVGFTICLEQKYDHGGTLD